ncbi:16S rRNA (cytidine(1402)-2'-O)-methyltransferase [bacterium]|nr:16S rRNA (cytidine(1402)-2'-O)-methyltransferase [bacterium]
MPGELFLIGSPIGNLSDISRRQLRTLGSLDILYCEDTRVTHKLISHFGISRVNLRSLPDDSKPSAWKKAIHEVDAGRKVGFITDAGMPGVSDPGRKLVRQAFEHGIRPQVIPGCSALGTLLAACPFVDNSFAFHGFIPKTGGKRTEALKAIAESTIPVLYFDSPHRVRDNMQELCEMLDEEREILIGREMTKLHEEFVLFRPAEMETVFKRIKIAGEFTLAVSARQLNEAEEHDDAELREKLALLQENGFSSKDAVKALSLVLDVKPNRLKKLGFGGS